MATATTPNRQTLIRHGKRLEYSTIAYNTAEGVASIVAGLVAGSVFLIGFGLDSVIEVASGVAFPDPAQFGNRSTFDTTLPCQHGIMLGLGYPYKGQVGFWTSNSTRN